jgi:PKD repeat protein
MNADGSAVVRVATGVGMAREPTWSPDGARLAFTCIVDPVSSPWWSGTFNLDMCAINADGSGFARLTSEPGSDSGPDWSPDGNRILFVTSRYGGTELVVMNPDGTDVTQVSPGLQGDSPSWSSDGTRIAFVYLTPWDPDAPWMPTSFVSIINADGTGFGSLAWGYGPVWRFSAGGLNDPPVASFTFECSGPACTFDASPSSDSDGTIASYGWQFGDGTTAAGATVTHTFAGGHDTRLIIMDNDAALGTSVQNVNQPPIVSFTPTCTGLTCTFDGSASFDPDGTISFFIWSFGDYTGSGTATMTHTYAAAGTYTVTLSATDQDYGTGAQSQSVTVVNVNAPPVASFTSTCSALTCSFNASASSDLDGAIVSYAWNFGDGTTGSGVAASHSYAASGSYTVTLTVTDNGAATGTQAQGVTAAPPDIHVGDLDGSRTNQQNTWTAGVTITIHDSSHSPLANAVVSGTWNDGSTGSCITNASGQCAASRSGILKKTNSVSFTVTNVARAAFVYKPADNHDPDGDSNGTTVGVTRP